MGWNANTESGGDEQILFITSFGTKTVDPRGTRTHNNRICCTSRPGRFLGSPKRVHFPSSPQLPTNQQRQSPEDVERLPKRVPTGVQNSLWRKTDVISIVIFHITFRAEIKQKRQKNNQHPSTESRKIKTETITLSGYPTRGKQNVCLPPLTLEYV